MTTNISQSSDITAQSPCQIVAAALFTMMLTSHRILGKDAIVHPDPSQPGGTQFRITDGIVDLPPDLKWCCGAGKLQGMSASARPRLTWPDSVYVCPAARADGVGCLAQPQ